MADEPVVDPNPPPDPTPSPQPAAPDPAQLARENAELRAQLQLHQETLRAIGQAPQRTEPTQTGYNPPATVTSETDLIRRIAQKTGQDEGTVAAYFPLLRATVEELASPVVSTLYGLADRVSETRAMVSIEDFKDLRVEAEKIVRDYRNRGVFLDWEQASELARMRLAPELARKRDERAAADAAVRQQQAAQVAPERTTGNARPTPGATRGQPSAADVRNMAPGPEKEKAIMDLIGDTSF